MTRPRDAAPRRVRCVDCGATFPASTATTTRCRHCRARVAQRAAAARRGAHVESPGMSDAEAAAFLDAAVARESLPRYLRREVNP